MGKSVKAPKAATVNDKAAANSADKPKKFRLDVAQREHAICRKCRIKGTAENEFTGLSPHAHHKLVVWGGGNQEKPRGPDCLKCTLCWNMGGWAEEYDHNDENFAKACDEDQGLQEAWSESTQVFLEHHNTGQRIRVVKSERYAKRCSRGIDSAFARIQSIRSGRKRLRTFRKRDYTEKISLKFCKLDLQIITPPDTPLDSEWTDLRSDLIRGGG